MVRWRPSAELQAGCGTFGNGAGRAIAEDAHPAAAIVAAASGNRRLRAKILIGHPIGALPLGQQSGVPWALSGTAGASVANPLTQFMLSPVFLDNLSRNWQE